MKRMLAAVALAVILAAPAAAQTTVKPGADAAVAFDQIDILSMMTYGSTPTDFVRDYAEALKRANDSNHPTMVFPSKTLKRFAYLHGQSRVETVATHQVVITKPGEIDTLDTLKKTYTKKTGDALKSMPLIIDGTALPLPQAGATPSPGSVDFSLTMDAAEIDPVTIGGVTASGYRATIKVSAENVTGSCAIFSRLVNVGGTIDNYVLPRPEPAAVVASPFPSFLPQDLSKLPFFDPKGCAIDGVSASLHHFRNFMGFGAFYLYRRTVITIDPSSGVALAPTLVSERGNVRDLTDADQALFEIPSDYKLAP